MAGSGKGVLRIAIEDFFTTTKVGKWLSGWYTDFIEDFEAGVATEYNAAFKELAEIPELKGIFDPSKFMPGSGKHQGGAAALLGFGLNLGMGAASAFLAPIFRLLNYKIDAKVMSARLDPNLLIQAAWKMGGLPAELQTDRDDLGYTTARMQAITAAMRPLLGIDQLLSAYHRGLMSQAEIETELSRMGFYGLDLTRIRLLGDLIPGIGDLMQMANRLTWDESIAQRFQTDANFEPQVNEWANKQGLSSDWVKHYWRMHWAIPTPQTGFEMLHRLRPGRTDTPFTADDMTMLLKIGDYPEFWFKRFLAISYNPFTRVDVRRMHKLKVITDQELLDTYLDLGYDEEHAKKLTEWTIQNETVTDKTKTEVARDLNQGTIVDAYQKKVIDRAKAVELLTGLKFDSQEVEIILKAAEFQKVVANKTDIVKTYNDQMRTHIVSAYASQMLSKDETTSMLSKLGYASDEITFILQFADFDYTETVLNDTLKLIGNAYIAGTMTQNDVITMLGKYNISGNQQTQLFSEWDTQRSVKTKRLTEAQYTAAWKRSLITDVEFRQVLADLGYSAKDIDLYVKISTPPAPAA